MLAATAGVTPAQAATVSPPQPVPGTEILQGVACPIGNTCFAVGFSVSGGQSQGVLVPITNGIPGAPVPVPGTIGLNAIACPSTTSCVAVGTSFDPVTRRSEAVVVPITNGIPGAPQPVPGFGSPVGVACADAATCFAVGNLGAEGAVVPIVNGVAGVPQAVPGTEVLRGIMCTSATTCLAVGSTLGAIFFQGVVVPITNGAIGAVQTPPGVGELNAVACPTPTTCLAVGTSEFFEPAIVHLSGPRAGAIDVVFELNLPLGISCLTATTCIAVGFAETGRVVSIVEGIPGEVQPVEGTNALYAVACTPAFCVAVGSNPANQGVVVIISEVPEPTCTQTLTGDVVGPVTVGAGQTVCVADAVRVSGPITVNVGGALILDNARVTGGIVATNPAFVRICGSQISGPSRSPGQGVVVNGSPVPVTVGDPDAGCAGNCIAGDVVLTGNAGLTLGGNLVSGNVTVDNDTGNVVVKANTVVRTLACSGNNPPPVNAGQPNTAGTKTGQCAAL